MALISIPGLKDETLTAHSIICVKLANAAEHSSITLYIVGDTNHKEVNTRTINYTSKTKASEDFNTIIANVSDGGATLNYLTEFGAAINPLHVSGMVTTKIKELNIGTGLANYRYDWVVKLQFSNGLIITTGIIKERDYANQVVITYVGIINAALSSSAANLPEDAIGYLHNDGSGDLEWSASVNTQSTAVVTDIAARDALPTPSMGDQAYVVDASADPAITEGTVLYIYTTEWTYAYTLTQNITNERPTFRNIWELSTSYLDNDVVIKDTILYQANSDIASSTAFVVGASANQWAEISSSESATFKNTWIITTAYSNQDIVIRNNKLYQANSNIAYNTAFVEGVSANQWTEVSASEGISPTDFATRIWNHSVEDYSNASAPLTPIMGVDTKVINDGLGAQTNIALAATGVGPVWNTTTSQFDFSDLSVGDTVTIRMDFEVTTNGSNSIIDVTLDMAIGSPSEGTPLYTLTVADQYYKSTGVYNLVILAEIFIGDPDTRDYPAEIIIRSDSNGESVLYHGHYVKSAFQHPLYI